MANTGPYEDTPGRIKSEGQTITLTFQKTNTTAGLVEWNVPLPSIGCNSDTQAYNGIVITIDTTPVNANKNPVNGVVYTADPTADTLLHAGSRMGSALVIGAFYDDKSTVSLSIDGLSPGIPYYVSAYAVDAQLRYHTSGVHAFSLPYGDTADPSTPGYHEVGIGFQDNTAPFDIILHQGTINGVNATDPTGLDNATTYCIEYLSDHEADDCDCGDYVQLQINGANAQTYEELVAEINTQIALVTAPPQSATYPNANSYYYDVGTGKLYLFTGTTHNNIPVTNSDTDPSLPTLDAYWYNTLTGVLSQWDGAAWQPLTFFSYHVNPVTELTQFDYWYNGTNVYQWEDVLWCERTAYIQSVDPTLPIELSGNYYWYDESQEVVFKWDPTCGQWVEINVITSDQDPNTIVSGAYWFNYETEILYVRNLANDGWDEFTARFEITETEPSMPAAGMAWFKPSTDELFIRNNANGWDLYPVLIYFSDPADRDSCDYWWNVGTDVLYVWDSVNSVWVQVGTFTIGGVDPSLGITPQVDAVWLNTTSPNVMYKWDGAQWLPVDFIENPTAPNEPTAGDYWYNSTALSWNVWNGSDWDVLEVLSVPTDPYTPTSGSFWYDTANNLLYMYNGVTWISIIFQTTPYTPVEGFVYLNTTDSTLYEWNGLTYVPATLDVTASLTACGNIVFVSSTTGSSSYVTVRDCEDGVLSPLFENLTDAVKFLTPRKGTDGLSGKPSYEELGVGTDGSDDERKVIINSTLHRLGYPGVNVELTKDQLDEAVRLALQTFRQKSASGYRRGFLFLNVEPQVQHYRLTDKSVGANKVVEVMAAYRIQSSFLGNATGQGAYGQAMLQHLYQMGSFDLLSYHIVSEYVELMNQMFAAYLVFTWEERTRRLSFHQTFGSNEKILLDVMVERTEQDLLTDRITRPWIEQYTLGSAQLMLAEIRGKFGSLPGAGGGVTLNAQDMRVAGETNIEACMQQLEDYTANEIESVGYEGGFILG